MKVTYLWVLSAEEREYLEVLTHARTIQAQTVSRARILFLKANGCTINEIADKIGINRKSVMLCLNKYAEGGVEYALFDVPGRGHNAEITDDENIACQKPVDFDYAAKTWTYAKLSSHINKHAEAAGYTRLSTIHKVLCIQYSIKLKSSLFASSIIAKIVIPILMGKCIIRCYSLGI